MLIYSRNPDFEFIGVEDTMAVFDPATGDTVVLDKPGMEIIKLTEAPAAPGQILDGLLQIFEGDREEIQDDLQEFLEQMSAQNILLVSEAEHAD